MLSRFTRMTPPPPHDIYRTRRWFFIGVEAVLVLAWCGLLLEQRFSFSGRFGDVCFWVLGISVAFLLFVLPWFWSTLRHIALVGWFMAAASVLYFLVYAPTHR
jgi:hypothetical protein